MDNFPSRNDVSSRDHTESSIGRRRFRNSRFTPPRNMGAYPAISSHHEEHHRYNSYMWHHNKYSYDSASSETYPSVVSYSQGPKRGRNICDAHQEEPNIHSNHQKSMSGQGEYRYHKRRGTSFPYPHDDEFSSSNNHQKYISDRISEGHNRQRRRQAQMGSYSSGDMHNYHNLPRSINDWRSGGNYVYYPQGGNTYFSGAHHGELKNYNSGQESITDRLPEGSYRHSKEHQIQMGTYLSDTSHKDIKGYNNCQKSAAYQSSVLEEKYRFYELPRKQNEWHPRSRNHASASRPRHPEFNPDVMTPGNNIRPLKGEHYKDAVRVPTCLTDVTSTAVSVKNVTIVNDGTSHGFSANGNAVIHSISDEKSETDIDLRHACSFSLKGTKKNLSLSNHVNVGNMSGSSIKDEKSEYDIDSRVNLSKHINVGNKEAAIYEPSAFSDAAVPLLQPGQTESIAPSKSVFQTSKKLLVLDLNGILVDILRLPNAAQIHADRELINVSKKTAFKRPFCDEFLDFCFDVFNIGVWSSRMKHNVEVVVDYIMGNRKKKLLFCWDNGKCTYTGCNTMENEHKPLVLKELSKLWDKEERDLPWENGTYSPSNTLLIDDSPYKALCNPPCTGIFPEPYDYKNAKDNSLGPGGELRVFLEGLVKADDVQEYVKKNPIGQPSITDHNKSWKFYLQVIERVEKMKKRNA